MDHRIGRKGLCIATLITSVIVTVLTNSGCSTAPVSQEISQDELQRRDRSLGVELAQSFERRLEFKRDTEISIFIRNVAQALLDATPELKGTSVGVWLFQEKTPRWKSYALPGNRIYLPIGLLKTLDYENELAAEIAFQLGHLMKRHLQERLLEQTKFHREEDRTMEGLWLLQNRDTFQNVDYFGPNGVFSFSEDAEEAVAQSAVGILYRAGYDPRGIISLCERYRNNIKHSPVEKSTILKMMEQARLEIATYAPLRNPIVRSQKFLDLQKRIQQL